MSIASTNEPKVAVIDATVELIQSTEGWDKLNYAQRAGMFIDVYDILFRAVITTSPDDARQKLKRLKEQQ